mmetsp:Transcript_27162/g.55369  ORF Transcript_27162/g.55369 Transcript_27162/m.55369 type:complete len:80 (+) Transcript_27162:459-698(+)
MHDTFAPKKPSNREASAGCGLAAVAGPEEHLWNCGSIGGARSGWEKDAAKVFFNIVGIVRVKEMRIGGGKRDTDWFSSL